MDKLKSERIASLVVVAAMTSFFGLLLSLFPSVAPPLQEAFAAFPNHTLSDQASCEEILLDSGATNATWMDPNVCQIDGGILVIEQGDDLSIESGIILEVTSNGTVDNSGRITNTGEVDNSGGTIANTGEIDNTGTIENEGTINNNSGGTITNTGEIDNSGGTINNNPGSVLTNNLAGTVDNSGRITNTGEIDNSGGTINNNPDGIIHNNHEGTINNNPDGVIANDGTVDNSGEIGSAGEIDNSGTVHNSCDGIIDGDIGTGNLPVDACPPTADSQSITTSKNKTLTSINLTGANSNDADPDFAALPLTFIVVSGPARGSLAGTNSSLTYTPDTDFSGHDSFTFVASDGTSNSTAATVSITVNPKQDDSSSVSVFPESHFESSPLDRIQVSSPAFVSANGVSISKATVGQQVRISGTLANHQEVPQDYAFIVQTTNKQDGFVSYVSWEQGTIKSGAAENTFTSWMPAEAGSYSVQIFVWTSVGTPSSSPMPLSAVATMDIEVK